MCKELKTENSFVMHIRMKYLFKRHLHKKNTNGNSEKCVHASLEILNFLRLYLNT
jgi:hypothetical protein